MEVICLSSGDDDDDDDFERSRVKRGRNSQFFKKNEVKTAKQHHEDTPVRVIIDIPTESTSKLDVTLKIDTAESRNEETEEEATSSTIEVVEDTRDENVSTDDPFSRFMFKRSVAPVSGDATAENPHRSCPNCPKIPSNPLSL